MVRARTMLSLLSILSLLLLAGCGGISEADAIKLAKQVAAKLPSPPRLTSSTVVSYVQGWPDTPGSVPAKFISPCGNPPIENPDNCSVSIPMTLTTILAAANSGSGQAVSFVVSWESESHSWLFNVDAGGRVSFIGEEGNKLPQMER